MKNNTTLRKGTKVGGLISLAAALPLLAAAQAAPNASDQDSTVQLNQYVVTGSNIPQAADALSVPVTVVSPAQMQNSGVESNVLDVLRKVSPAVTGVGSENATLATANNYGGSEIAIHNLPTLVLIDGRRMAYDPSDAGGGLEFVDLNMIPMAAVQRIEVLSDGASAIYGGDAVGGVVNVILKKEFNGWEVSGHYGISDNTGHYSERSASIVGGVRDDKTTVTVSAEYSQQDPIFESARRYTNPFYATTYIPGIIEVFGLTSNPSDPSYGYNEAFQLNPSKGTPPGGGQYSLSQLVAMGYYTDLGSFNDSGVVSKIESEYNLADRETLQQYSKRSAATIDLEHKILGDKLVAFGNFIYGHTDTWSQLNAQPLFPYISDPNSDIGFNGGTPTPGTQYVPISAPTNPFSQASLDQGYTDGSGGYPVQVHQRFVSNPRVFNNDSTSTREVVGLKGQVTSSWSWETAVDLSRYDLAYQNAGLLSAVGLNNAFISGQVNPFAYNQAPGALTGVVGTGFLNSTSTLNSWDAVVRGSVFTLPGGDINIAVGGQFQRQNLTANPDMNSADDLWIDSPTILPFNKNRTVGSVYGEIEIPVVSPQNNITGIHSFAVDYAQRLDHYSTVGNSTVPKVDVKYQPFDDQLTLRASAGKSFIAPTLYSLFGPVTQGSSQDISYTGSNGTQYSEVQFQDVGGSNTKLKPQKSTTWTAGAVYSPKGVPGLNFTVDYYQTVEKGVISSIDQATIIQSVENLGAASPYASNVHFGSATGPGPSGNTPGQISSKPFAAVYLVTPDVNLGSTAVKGYDAAIDYHLPTASFGSFDFGTAVTGYNSFLIQALPTENYYQYSGHVSTVAAQIAGVGGTLAKWRTYTSIEWKWKGFDALVAQTFVPRVTDVGSGGSNANTPLWVASYDQYDFAVGYDLSKAHLDKWLDGIKVRVGVNNAFDYMPPVAPYGQQQTLADVGAYNGAVGRMFFVDASYKF